MAGAALSKHVVLVDWDGFEPALLSRGYALPNLNSLAKSGSLSTAQSTYTTFSNPARGSMSTGAYPERHGNVAWVFDPTANLVIGQTRELAAETIAEALARESGRTFASVQWYMVQNRGAAYGDPTHLYVQPGGDFGNRVSVAIDILFRRPVNSGGQLVTVPKIPDMLAVYGPDPDEISHEQGTQSPNMRTVMEQQDRDLGRLIQATKNVGIYKNTTFVLTGDHGMTDWNRSALGVLSQAVTEAGYVPEVLYAGDSPQNSDSNVIIAPAVRVAYLTLRGPLAGNSNARDRIRTALAAHTEIESVLGSTELDGLHAGPKLGDLVAEARPPWSFAKADLPAGTLKAAHGSRAELDVPLYLAGAGVRRTKPSQPRIVDVAPTISALLGMPCPAQAQGRPLSETFTSPAACPASSSPRTLVYALGDGADGSTASRALADYVKAQNPDRFFYLGDVYESGTAAEFASNYDPLYGSMAAKTDPVIGNHEYPNRSTGYYPFWQNKRGWTQEQADHRSYVDAASGWQVIAYSSETDMTAEGNWVGGEVAKHGGNCRIVMAHKGRHVVTDTEHDDNPEQESVWSRIIGKTAINLVGHNHIYGRLAPLNGVNVLVSGTGGHGLRSLGTQHHPVAASKTGVPTATRLVLRRGAADFAQVGSNGTVYDSGTITCTPA